MIYNTERETLIFKEYGRNIQNIVEYIVGIEDKEKRNYYANGIINFMSQMAPNLRNTEEFQHKLWDHLHMISKYKLEVEAPFPPPEPEAEVQTKAPLAYPERNRKFRHYGKNVQTMIQKAVELEDEEKKMEFARIIGGYMKMVYRNWNKEHISDEVIIGDLKSMSEDQLVLSADCNLDALTRSTRKRRKPQNKSSHKGRSHHNGRSNNRRKNYRK